jgi:hypothetical protein
MLRNSFVFWEGVREIRSVSSYIYKQELATAELCGAMESNCTSLCLSPNGLLISAQIKQDFGIQLS